jgi:hypothetical protein
VSLEPMAVASGSLTAVTGATMYLVELDVATMTEYGLASPECSGWLAALGRSRDKRRHRRPVGHGGQKRCRR